VGLVLNPREHEVKRVSKPNWVKEEGEKKSKNWVFPTAGGESVKEKRRRKKEMVENKPLNNVMRGRQLCGTWRK